MNVSPKLINLTVQVKANDQNTHQLATSTEKLDDKAMSKALAEDVYHTGEHMPKNHVTYEKPIQVKNLIFKLGESESFTKSQATFFNELTDQLSFIRPHFNKMKTEIENAAPTLKDKDWGYSVNEKGKLIALGEINENERSLIEEKLNQDGRFVRLNQDVPEILNKGLEYERAVSGRSKYWGKYDVTPENFKDVIDMKSLLKSTQGRHADEFYNGVDAFSYEKNLGTQLARNAEIKYGF